MEGKVEQERSLAVFPVLVSVSGSALNLESCLTDLAKLLLLSGNRWLDSSRSDCVDHENSFLTSLMENLETCHYFLSISFQ